MYTSGSTGRPKGVMVEHRSLAGFVHWGLSNFSADELDAVLASTSLGFDISILELLVPLAIGGRVVLVENLLALGAPLEVEVTLVNTVPSLMTALLHDAEVPASVRTVVLAGEPLSPELADSVWRQVGVRRVVNARSTRPSPTSPPASVLRSAGPSPGPRRTCSTPMGSLFRREWMASSTSAALVSPADTAGARTSPRSAS